MALCSKITSSLHMHIEHRLVLLAESELDHDHMSYYFQYVAGCKMGCS